MMRYSKTINALLIAAIVALAYFVVAVGTRKPKSLPPVAIEESASAPASRAASGPASQAGAIPRVETSFYGVETPFGSGPESPYAPSPYVAASSGAPFQDIYVNLEKRNVFETIIPMPTPEPTAVPTPRPPPPLRDIIASELKLSGITKKKVYFETTHTNESLIMEANGKSHSIIFNGEPYNLTLIAIDSKNFEVQIKSDKHPEPVTIKMQDRALPSVLSKGNTASWPLC